MADRPWRGDAAARPEAREFAPVDGRLILLRVVVVVALVLAWNYIIWRWTASVHWGAWWIAVPLVLAETYSVIDVTFFGLTMWRSRQRMPAGDPIAGATVDVFITTYNEPIDLVMRTAAAARAIEWPHETYVLDDGARPELREAAERLGVGYITRSPGWEGYSRHAKAGNINNALEQTAGEFILILDADMIPRPEILRETLGYFRGRRMALVQTPQVFSNVATGDPLGSQAPLFYGPIQQGKDGWNAAFFCGSNAVLRREALLELGVSGYVHEIENRTRGTLADAARIIAKARRTARGAGEAGGVGGARTTPHTGVPHRDAALHAALDAADAAVRQARQELRDGEPIAEITYRLQRAVDAAAAGIVTEDLRGIRDDLEEIARLSPSEQIDVSGIESDAVVALLSRRELSPLNALEALQLAVRRIDVDRGDEAQAIMPLATISVTEDMATSMRLHARGWKTAFHNALLADGLAPEDLGTMLTQRLRWAQGTIQVMLRENPLFVKGMSLMQRLMYFSTMWSYLAGFAAIAYFAAPIIMLVFGVLPITAYSGAFFWHFVPFIVVNQLLFLVAARGLPTWRGQQYSLALFPVWIKACVTAFNNVVFRLPLDFAVTPKTRAEVDGPQLGRIKWQIIAAALLLVAAVVGVIRLIVFGLDPVAILVNLVWIGYDFLALSVLIGAVRYKGYQAESPEGAR